MPSTLEVDGRKAGVFFTAAELVDKEFPEPRWAVPGLISEGLNLLVGASKIGKSWLCLGIATAVATGGRALGSIDVDPGAVLYLALEDTPRRLQNRLGTVLGNDPAPDSLHVLTSIPKGTSLELISDWLDHHTDARLVIIDVLRKIRPTTSGRDMYAEDYDFMGSLKALADKHAVAVVVVHHTRKTADETDVFNEVSGSTGLVGAADAILIAKRGRNEADAVLHVTGRDVTEHDYGMKWNADTCAWTLTDQPAKVALIPPAQRRVLNHLQTSGAATPQQIADELGMSPGTTRSSLSRLADKELVEKGCDGLYSVATAATLQRDATDRCSVSPVATFRPTRGTGLTILDGGRDE